MVQDADYNEAQVWRGPFSEGDMTAAELRRLTVDYCKLLIYAAENRGNDHTAETLYCLIKYITAVANYVPDPSEPEVRVKEGPYLRCKRCGKSVTIDYCSTDCMHEDYKAQEEREQQPEPWTVVTVQERVPFYSNAKCRLIAETLNLAREDARQIMKERSK